MNLPHFQNPWFLLALFVLPILIWDYFHKQQKRKASIRFPSLQIVKRIPQGWAYKARHSLLVLRLCAIALLSIALARPQWGESIEDISTNGVDIMLALDISSSMRTMDFKPNNRLFVAKQVIEDFVLGRKHDRIGLVVFSGKSFTQCPLTLDYGILTQFLQRTDFGMVEDGTAIGTAILNGVNRLRNSDAKSKIIILLTDGSNNSGEVDPITAAKAAQALGIKIYTIGVGKDGDQPLEIDDPIFGKRIVSVRTDVDVNILKQIAESTHAKFYRAQDAEALVDIYQNIDKLEKTEIKTTSYYRYHELFYNIAIASLILILLEIVLANTRFMKIP